MALSTTRTGVPPMPRRSARSVARSRWVQYQPVGAAAQRARGDQCVEQRSRWPAPNSARSASVSGSSAAAAAQVRAQHVRVRGVEHGRLDGLAEERLGVVHEVGVQRVVAGDQHRERALPGAAGAAGLLPQRRARARAAGEQHRVEAGDVDAELEGVGGGDAEQVAASQALSPGPGAPRGDSRRGRRRPARQAGVDLGQGVPREQRDHLGAAAGPDEGERAHVLHDQVGEQVGRLGRCGPARRGAPFSPCSSVSGGSQSAKTVSPRGEASSVTARTGSPVRRRP